MPSNLPRLTIRMNQEIIDAIGNIAKKEKRSTNQQVTYVIEQYINQYEKEHGEIFLDGGGTAGRGKGDPR